MFHRVFLVLLILSLLFHPCDSFSIQRNAVKMTSASPLAAPRGSAKVPFDKKKVAVMGAGGYLGGCAFGFLQRCSSLYGSGIGGVRNIGATAYTSDSLNRILGKNFILAYAGEDMVRLTDMTDCKSITQRLQGYYAVIMSTNYYLERRPVTGNTYEGTPNDKTYEFYLDTPRRGIDEEGMIVNPEYQRLLFENTLQACQDSDSVQHLVVIESPATSTDTAQLYAKLLDESNTPFTYIKVNGSLENFKDYTFSKGIQGNLQIDSFTFSQDYTTQPDYKLGSWMDELSSDSKSSGVVYREDVAALAVQCLQSLDWSTSRCLVVSSSGSLEKAFMGRVDKEWCVNADVLAEKLAIVQ